MGGARYWREAILSGFVGDAKQQPDATICAKLLGNRVARVERAGIADRMMQKYMGQVARSVCLFS